MASSAIKKDFTSGPLLSKIIWFTLPLLATSVLQLLFNTADTVVVGRWGGDTPEACNAALAAVGSCGALTNLIIGLFMGLSVGAGVCVAHDIGAKHLDSVSKTVHTSIVASLVCGVIVTVFGIAMARLLLELMNSPPDVIDQAVRYMRAYFCGMTANMLYNFCAAILRSAGDTTRPLAFLSVAGIVNVLLNLVMVIVFRTGAMGVGIATAVSQWVSCVLIILYMMKMDGPCRVELSKLRVSMPQLKKMVMIGLPAGIQGTLFSISNVIIQSSINSFGTVAIAGNTAASNIDSYVYATQNSLYHTALTFVGQNVGARKYDRVKKSILYSLVCVCTVGIVMGTTVFLCGEPLLRIFAPNDPAVVDAGMVRLSIMGILYFLCGAMEVGSGVLRGFGKSMTSMIISLIGSCALRLVYVYTIFAMFPEPKVLYYSYPISWILTASVLFIFAFAELRKRTKNSQTTPTLQV